MGVLLWRLITAHLEGITSTQRNTLAEFLYSIVVPPNDEIAFKLQTNSAIKKDKYASYKVHILDFFTREGQPIVIKHLRVENVNLCGRTF